MTKLISNVTGLVDLTLKHDKNQIEAIKYPSDNYMFTVSKKPRTTTQHNNKTTARCQIYSKLTIKTPEQHLVFLLLTLNIYHTYFYD